MGQDIINKVAIEDYLAAQEWRYAAKSFDATQKVSEEDIEFLMKAIQLSASSFGLQAYNVLIIEDQALREKLRKASWDQRQITEASQIFVFCIYDNLKDEHIDAYMDNMAATRDLPIDALGNFSSYLKSTITPWTEKQKNIWMAKQTYIALGSLMNACAVMGIDACPMEGFDPAQYDEILDLKSKNLKAVLVAPVGYRSPEDATASNKKVRKPMNELFQVL